MNLSESEGYVLGIDMGGTHTVFGIVTPEGDVVSRGHIDTKGYDSAEKWADALYQAVSTAADKIGVNKFVGIGVGAPCANMYTGAIEAATDLPWPSPIPLKQILTQRFNTEVTITNDANAAAAGEMMYGAAKGLRNFIMLTLGTGVGSGIVCDGYLLSGSRGFAGELGHVIIDHESSRLCGCGRKGCLQCYCSAKGVMTTWRELSGTPDDEQPELTPLEIYNAALQGDTIAIETFRNTGEVLGRACADFAAFTDPEAIILFGGVANALPLMQDAFESAFRQNSLHLYRDRVRLLRSILPGADAAILGAAALVACNP